MHPVATLNDIEAESKDLLQQGQLTDDKFLMFAYAAAHGCLSHWHEREHFAYYVADVWLRQANLSTEVYELGSRFADLELPDEHITTEQSSVKEEWEALETSLALALKK